LFWLCLADYAFLALGSVVAGIVLDIDISSAFVNGLFLAVLAMPAAALAGTAFVALCPRSSTARRSRWPEHVAGYADVEGPRDRTGVDEHRPGP
jgi:hypothetical protein